jgi:hypothetical protein
MTSDLSEAELNAIDFLKQRHGCCLISEIDDKTSTDVFGMKVPGMTIFKKLAKKGLLYFTEEDPVDFGFDEPFTFTPMVYLGKPED